MVRSLFSSKFLLHSIMMFHLFSMEMGEKINHQTTNWPQKWDSLSNACGFYFYFWIVAHCNMSVCQVSSSSLLFPQCVRVCLSHLRLLCSLQHVGGVRAPLQLPAQTCVLLLPSLPPKRPAPRHSHSGVAWHSFHYPRSETRYGKSQGGEKKSLVWCSHSLNPAEIF